VRRAEQKVVPNWLMTIGNAMTAGALATVRVVNDARPLYAPPSHLPCVMSVCRYQGRAVVISPQPATLSRSISPQAKDLT
jgi:hypothetical protein